MPKILIAEDEPVIEKKLKKKVPQNAGKPKRTSLTTRSITIIELKTRSKVLYEKLGRLRMNGKVGIMAELKEIQKLIEKL